MRDALNLRALDHLARCLRCSTQELLDTGRNAGRYYRRFTIERKGKLRPVRQPTGRLAALQGRLTAVLQELPWPAEFHGGIRRRSARTNAAQHLRASRVFQADIRDFFPSVRPEMVYEAFVAFGCSPDVARVLTQLTTLDHCVPQGARSSTMVANLVLWHLCLARLKGAARARKARPTLYVDDLTVSAKRSLGGMARVADAVVTQSGLALKRQKTVVGAVDDGTVITGYHPSPEGLRMPAGYLRQVETEIEQFGAMASTTCPEERARVERSIRGRIQYVASAEPREAQRLAKLLSQAMGRAGQPSA